MRRPAIVIFITVCILAVTAGTAAAATTAQVMRDFNADESIDGNYTLTELRAANAAYPAAQREYFDAWEIAYRAAVKRVTSPPGEVALPVVPPRDINKDGKIDDAERKAAAAKTAAARKAAAAAKVAAEKGTPAEGNEPPEVEPVEEKLNDGSSGDDDSRPWGVIIVAGFIALAAAIAIWRVLRHHRANRDPRDPRGPNGPET